MKLNSKRVNLEYQPGEEIFTFPDETGLPFIFDMDKELTSDPAAMDIVGQMLDEAESFAEKAKKVLKKVLANEDHGDHGTVAYFMEFHRDEVDPDTAGPPVPRNQSDCPDLWGDGGLPEAEAFRQLRPL